MDFFGAAHGWGGQKGPPPSLKSVTHILQWWNLAQLYLKQTRSRKYMNHLTRLLISANISFFSPEISKFCYIKKYRYRLYVDAVDSAKMAAPGLLKIKVFWNVIMSYILSMTSPTKFCHFTQIILWMWSCDQSLVTLDLV